VTNLDQKSPTFTVEICPQNLNFKQFYKQCSALVNYSTRKRRRL